MRDWDRREFLAIITAVPGVVLFGCDSGGQKTRVQTTALSPEDSMKKLILALGPWSANEEAEGFANRFVNVGHAVGPYLPGSSAVVQNLAARFPEPMKIHEIDLTSLPAEERKLLLDLTRQLYSYTEVRFLVCGEPQAGECQADNTWHTRIPDGR
jgi:hypothetical protein